MKILLGHDFFDARSGRTSPVEFDTANLINPHLLIVGSSGVGKSYTIRRLINGARQSSPGTRFHVFDVHGDLDIPGASVAQFSEVAPFGLNPLRVNPDPEFGGVRKAVQAFMRIINQASTTSLGVKQESVLRNLLYDVYRDFGFDAEDASTWSLNAYESRLISGGADNRLYLQVPLDEKDEAKGLGARWDGNVKLWWVQPHTYKGTVTKWPPAYKERQYPSLKDVAVYARRLHEERFLGSDQDAVRALVAHNKNARATQRRVLDAARLRQQHSLNADDQAALDESCAKAVASYSKYVETIRTGFELEALMKYDSPEVVKSVLDRLNNLIATGIFKSAPPPFDPAAGVWRYKLNALSMEEKKMLVLFLMQELFNNAVQRGEQTRVVDVLVLDELSTYTSSEDERGDGIIGVIARQARKFGQALWAADQTPRVPESLISSVGTKIVLGLDEMFWNEAVSKLRIDSKLLEWVAPKATMAVQLKEAGSLKNRWRWVQLPNR